MRNLFPRVISGFALAMVLAGSASAASMPNAGRQPTVSNLALQSQFDRDSNLSEAWLHRTPLGQVIVPGSAYQSADGARQMGADRDGHMHPARDN